MKTKYLNKFIAIFVFNVIFSSIKCQNSNENANKWKDSVDKIGTKPNGDQNSDSSDEKTKEEDFEPIGLSPDVRLPGEGEAVGTPHPMSSTPESPDMGKGVEGVAPYEDNPKGVNQSSNEEPVGNGDYEDAGDGGSAQGSSLPSKIGDYEDPGVSDEVKEVGPNEGNHEDPNPNPSDESVESGNDEGVVVIPVNSNDTKQLTSNVWDNTSTNTEMDNTDDNDPSATTPQIGTETAIIIYQNTESSPIYEYVPQEVWPIWVLSIVFICYVILGFVWILLRYSAIQRDEEKQIKLTATSHLTPPPPLPPPPPPPPPSSATLPAEEETVNLKPSSEGDKSTETSKTQLGDESQMSSKPAPTSSED